MSLKDIVPVILCGGSGTRLWPLSRKSFPKQFLDLGSESNSKKSLFQLTIDRLKKLNLKRDPIVICNEENRFLVAEQLRALNIKPHAIILEPFGRNTAPAVNLAALKALQLEKDILLLILSSDHIISLEDQFKRAINTAIKYASKNRLITFGILPTSPETGYGYIKSAEPLIENPIKGSNIEKFIEKPDLKNAKKFIKDKKFSWNSGIFLFKANQIIEETKKYCPDVYNFCAKALRKDIFDLDFQRIDKESFIKCPDISIDYAVMEKTKIGTVIPLSAGWNDLGSWDAVWRISPKDSNGNFIQGNIITKDSKNCYLRSEKRLIATIGIEDLAIIETSDAILISGMKDSQKVKDIVNILKNMNIIEGLNHQKIYRPWGHYETLVENKNWKVKLISVKAGEKLSLQKHKHRSEHWVVVSGKASVQIEDKEFSLNENQSCYIPKETKHRLSNLISDSLSIIEVQCGNYLGEDDIERFEDNYGRTNRI